MKILPKIIKITLTILIVATVIICTVYFSVVGICWGFDIFKVKDLADFIGWDNIEYVTAGNTHIELILRFSSCDTVENADKLSYTEKTLAYLEEINSYINSNDRYKKKKVRIQFGERHKELIGLSNVVSFANYSLADRDEERYDGFYSMMWERGISVDFDTFYTAPWDNIREIEFWNYFVPEDTKAIEKLENLKYLYFHEDLDESVYNELRRYAPWCEIKYRTLIKNEKTEVIE